MFPAVSVGRAELVGKRALSTEIMTLWKSTKLTSLLGDLQPLEWAAVTRPNNLKALAVPAS